MSKSSRIVALMIGRGGSSLKGKNVLPVHGVPLMVWAASAALRSAHIGRYYVSSDDDEILETGRKAGYTPIRRPDELASATAQSSDAVRHAMKLIEAEGDVDIVVVQHANVGTITEHIVDDCIDGLLQDPSLSSVVPCHDMSEYHPYRGKTVREDGTLAPFVPGSGNASANRQELPTCLFFDHSIWALRASAVWDKEGQGPWPVMGQRIKPYLTEGCFDVHTLEDVVTTEAWITAHGVTKPAYPIA